MVRATVCLGLGLELQYLVCLVPCSPEQCQHGTPDILVIWNHGMVCTSQVLWSNLVA